MDTIDTIIVTGGAGFIGSNFVHHLLAHTDSTVVIIDKLTYAGNLGNLGPALDDSRVHFFQDDICDRDALQEIFDKHRPTAVVNFAAESHVDRSIDGPRPFIETNFVGTFELLEVARKYLRNLTDEARDTFRFLHVSTDEVYGSLGETGAFLETTPYSPNSPYSASKAAADHLALSYVSTYGFPAIVTNCSNNFGPYQFPEKLIPLMILNALSGKELPIYGDGLNVRDWLYVEDHCSGILLALRKGRSGECYNIGGGNERTNIEVIDRICDVLDQHRPAAENPALQGRVKKSYRELKTFVEDRPGHDRRYAIDATKISTELGWKADFGFDDGMERTVRWYLNNEKWCEDVQSGNYRRERLGLGGR